MTFPYRPLEPPQFTYTTFFDDKVAVSLPLTDGSTVYVRPDMVAAVESGEVGVDDDTCLIHSFSCDPFQVFLPAEEALSRLGIRVMVDDEEEE